MGSTANLLDASLKNREGADHGACIYSAYGESTGDDDPAHGSEHVYPATPPSAYGGAGGEPSGWHRIAEHLEGLVWPDADTGRLRTAGSAWTSFAAVLDEQQWSATAAAGDMSTQQSPEAPIAEGAATGLATHCTDLAQACRDVGTACTDYADQVDEHHDEVIGILEELLAWTAVDQVTGAILSFVGGSPHGVEAAARAAGALVLRLELAGLSSREALSDRAARLFDFPYPSAGLDGLSDMLSDLEWLDVERGVVLVVDAEGGTPSVVLDVVDMLPRVSDTWRAVGLPFVAWVVGLTEPAAALATLDQANARLARAATRPGVRAGTGPVDVVGG